MTKKDRLEIAKISANRSIDRGTALMIEVLTESMNKLYKKAAKYRKWNESNQTNSIQWFKIDNKKWEALEKATEFFLLIEDIRNKKILICPQ